MAKSMTAYGRSTGMSGGKSVTVEIKSVNSRFFDPTIKITRNYSFLEEKVKSYLQSKISRGKVDVWIGIEVLDTAGCRISLDRGYAESYIGALEELRDTFSLKDDITVMRVAANRDLFVISQPEEDIELIWQEVLPFLDEALDAFSKSRAQEGENLANDLLKKKKNIESIVSEIAKRSEECVASYREKLEARIRKILEHYEVSVDENRLLTETAIFADKIAIDEELVRLKSHFEAFDRIFTSDEPVGRKLDFLVQEMNRETNTIGSKCSDSEIAHRVVDIKCELEKIREQIQNLE